MNISILPDDNYALMDLLCWLDIESFRRTPHLESVKRDGKAKDIKTKYLNKKYYFGSKSPATRKQQNEVKIAFLFASQFLPAHIVPPPPFPACSLQ